MQQASCGHSKNSSSDPLRSLARYVTSKLEEGNFIGAVCAASSEDSIAEITAEVTSVLEGKHSHKNRFSCCVVT